MALALIPLLLALSGPPTPKEIASFPSPGSASQMAFSPAYGLLFLRTGVSAIRVVDAATGRELGVHQPHEQFTDMSLSPDGRYLFVADFGGEVVGYKQPKNPSYVHRFDSLDRSWQVGGSGIAYRIEAVDASSFLLLTEDQWAELSLNAWGTPAQPIVRSAFGYEGDFVYDARNARAIHVNTNLSDNRIEARRIGRGRFAEGEHASYNDLRPFGETVVLSSDGQNLFVGPLQLDALDVSKARHTYPVPIYAASDRIAFGESDYFDIKTGQPLGKLGFGSTVYAIPPDGKSLWAMEAKGEVLHLYTLQPGYKLPTPRAARADAKPGQSQSGAASAADFARRYTELFAGAEAQPMLDLMDTEEMAARVFGADWNRLGPVEKRLIATRLGALIERELKDARAHGTMAAAAYSNFEARQEGPVMVVSYVVKPPQGDRRVTDLFLKRTARGWRVVDQGDDSSRYTQRLGEAYRHGGRGPVAESETWASRP